MSQPESSGPNWGALSTLAMAVGVREAARRMGVNENTAISRSRREKWFSDPVVKKALVNIPRRPRASGETPAVPPPQGMTAPQAMAQEFTELGQRSRMGFARAATRAAESAAKMTGTGILDNAHEIKAMVGVASTVHRWDEQPAKFKIELRITGAHAPSASEPEAMEAEWSDVDTGDTLPAHG